MFKRFIKDIRKYFRYSVVSARSQLRSEVANSYLNWLWWVLEPFCFMLIYTFMFGYVFGAKEPYFPVFIFIGISMWDFFNRMLKDSVRIVKNNKPIVSKVYLPKYILVLTKIWVNGFKMLVSFGIVSAMMLAWNVKFTWNILYAVPTAATLLTFSFWCSCWLLHYGVFVEDLANVVTIALRMLFYLTGIFYDVAKRIPAPYGERMVRCNPLAFLLECMRRALLYGKVPHRKELLLWFAVSLVLSGTGIRKIYKNENSYVKSI